MPGPRVSSRALLAWASVLAGSAPYACHGLPSVRPPVDPATPSSAHKTTDSTGTELKLVFSDEFETAGREFGHGKDPYWEAVDHYNPSTADNECYTPDAVTTVNGSLEITADDTPYKGHPFSSGMLTSWNQLCFTGGVVEVSLKLPGDPAVQGYWPAVWMMGNLARAGYGASTARMWPWSYDTCDTDSKDYQRISACNDTLPKQGLTANVGRGAPEFDIVEANLCPTRAKSDLMRCPNDTDTSGAKQAGPRLFSTMHFTPKNPSDQPYDGIQIGDDSTTHNNIDGDGLHDFLGVTTVVSPSLWNKMHTYRFQWVPSGDSASNSSDTKQHNQDDEGSVRWELDGNLLGEIDAQTLRAREGKVDHYKVGQRLISKEPMYLIFNVAISSYWKQRSPKMTFPGKMLVDYVRVYQDPAKEQVSCDPKDMPTAEYIKLHPHLYDGTPMPMPPPTCNPKSKPAQMCPGPKPCPQCGKPSCPCPPKVLK